MKKTLLLVIAALVIPSVALAAKPAHGPKHGVQVTYELKGTLSNYTAYDAGTSTNGTITINVSAANYHGKELKGQTLTFAVDANTSVALKSGLSTITNGDSGMIRVRAAAFVAPADLAATLQASYSVPLVAEEYLNQVLEELPGVAGLHAQLFKNSAGFMYDMIHKGEDQIFLVLEIVYDKTWVDIHPFRHFPDRRPFQAFFHKNLIEVIYYIRFPDFRILSFFHGIDFLARYHVVGSSLRAPLKIRFFIIKTMKKSNFDI